MRAILKASALALAMLIAPASANAFCGFFVAKGDSKLFNEASKVVMVRDGNRTVLTMANDFQGDVKDFAMVIPAPTVLKRKQIHVSENAIIDHLDAFTAPRLVEYFDRNPCEERRMLRRESASETMAEPTAMADRNDRARVPRRASIHYSGRSGNVYQPE